MQPVPTTLVGTTARSTEAAFRVLGGAGKARALKIARYARLALEQAGQPPSDGVNALVAQIEAAEHDAQVVGKLEALGVRVVDRLKPILDKAKKSGVDFARALEERVLAEEAEEARQALQAKKADEAKKTPPAAAPKPTPPPAAGAPSAPGK